MEMNTLYFQKLLMIALPWLQLYLSLSLLWRLQKSRWSLHLPAACRLFPAANTPLISNLITRKHVVALYSVRPSALHSPAHPNHITTTSEVRCSCSGVQLSHRKEPLQHASKHALQSVFPSYENLWCS